MTIMRYLLFVIAVTALAQTAGTINKTTVSTISAAAGTITCTFTNQNPSLPTGVSASCKAGAAGVDQTSVVPVGNTSGIVGSFHSGLDSVTWMLRQPTAGTVTWDIAANGVSQSGTF